jgi:hypothetical protein
MRVRNSRRKLGLSQDLFDLNGRLRATATSTILTFHLE